MVGGAQKNKSGYIREIGALQSVVQLMGPRDMLDYWSNTYKVHTLRWNLETAQEILQEFQERFQEEVEKELEKEKYEFNSYSSLALKNLMNKFSTGSITNIVAGYIIMVSLCDPYWAAFLMFMFLPEIAVHFSVILLG